MYGPKARAARRCRERRKDGRFYGAWACWDDPEQRCVAHAGRHHRGSLVRRPPDPIDPFAPSSPWVRANRARYVPCDCSAFAFPHRPGSGRCRWPETTPRPSREPPRTRPAWLTEAEFAGLLGDPEAVRRRR